MLQRHGHDERPNYEQLCAEAQMNDNVDFRIKYPLIWSDSSHYCGQHVFRLAFVATVRCPHW